MSIKRYFQSTILNPINFFLSGEEDIFQEKISKTKLNKQNTFYDMSHLIVSEMYRLRKHGIS